jgi:hypothetical protein
MQETRLLDRELVRRRNKIMNQTKGSVRDINGNEIAWKIEGDFLVVASSIKFDVKEITHSDQVIRLIDSELATVAEWQNGKGEWIKYR